MKMQTCRSGAKKTLQNLLTSKLGYDTMTLQIKLGKEEIAMNREEILNASRNENRNKDIYELEVISRGQHVAGLIGICITVVLMAIENVRSCWQSCGQFLPSMQR
jgi:hypothetical protein